MSEMNSKEFNEFLSRPLIASMTTVGIGGLPQVTPIWYEYDGELFHCVFQRNSVKARNLRRDPRVTLCIATHDDPYSYVVAGGKCEISVDGVEDLCYSISTRYLGEKRGREFAHQSLDTGGMVVLKMRPNKVLAQSHVI